MEEVTIKDYINDGFSFTFCVNDMHRYEGLLNGRYGILYLTEGNLEDLNNYENIYNLLNNSFKIIKITGQEGNYLLQLLDLHYEGPYNEERYYLLEDMESDRDLENLLEKYDNKVKKETNVKNISN